MKLIGIVLIIYLVQGINSDALIDLQKTLGSLTKSLFGLLGSSGSESASKKGSNGPSATPIKLDNIQLSLQTVFADVDNAVQSIDPLSTLSSLPKSLDSVFKRISSICRVVGPEVGGIMGLVETALNAVNAALSNLINIIVNSISATVTDLSSAIDQGLDDIIQSLIGLVEATKTMLRSIKNRTPAILSSVNAIIKNSIVAAFKSMRSVSSNLQELDKFITPQLSHMIKVLPEQMADIEVPDLNVLMDVDAIVAELQKCSDGAIIDVEMVSSALEDSRSGVDVIVTGISTSQPDDEEWQDLFDKLKEKISKSVDEILHLVEHVTQQKPEWNQIINTAVMNTLFAIQDLISATSNGNGEKVEPAINNIAVAIQGLLNGLNSVTTAANGKSQPDELVSNILASIERSVQSVNLIVSEVLVATAKGIEGNISSTSILPALSSLIDTCIHAEPATLVTFIPKINDIVNL